MALTFYPYDLRDPNHVSGLGPELHTITVAGIKPPLTFYPYDLRDPNHVSGLGPELHTITVAKHFGDWYATCGCMAVSLPSWNQAAAERWVCPRAEAEVTVLRNKVRWDARVADAAVRARD